MFWPWAIMGIVIMTPCGEAIKPDTTTELDEVDIVADSTYKTILELIVAKLQTA